MPSKNTIFYGPSQTGKSYHTIIECMRILGSEYINPDKNYVYSADEYKKIINEFDLKRNLGDIEVIGFHESFSYAEFIEGSKLDLHDNNQINITERSGCFKKFAQMALFECIDVPKEKLVEIFSFKKIINYFKEVYPVSSIFQIESSFFEIINYTETAIIIKPSSKSSFIEIKYDILKELISKSINRQILGYEIKEILANEKGKTTFYYAIFTKLNEIINAAKITLINEFHKGAYNLKTSDVKPFVLVIEEIANCDISKVFGELISLLDEDYREMRKVRLPYSYELFTLPNNLFIIGTITTPLKKSNIDNLELLMRKFAMTYLTSNSNLVADFGCDFSSIFEVLNTKISILLGDEYQIGHGFFAKEKYENADIDVLQDLWFKYVQPRLKLYFRNDMQKLQMLFGNATNTPNSFLKVKHTKMDLEPNNTNEYIHLVTSPDDDFNFKKALEYAFRM